MLLVGLTEGLKILVDKPILLLGRDPECDVQFDSRKISRRHCCIAQIRDQLVVRDLGSTNGVRINGVRVVEGYLKAGDELTVGSHRYVVRWEAAPPGPGRPAQKNDAKRDESPVPAAAAGDAHLESSEEPIPLMAEEFPGTGKMPGANPRGDPLAVRLAENGSFGLDVEKPIPGLDAPELSLAPISEDFPSVSPRQAPAKDPKENE